MPKVTRKHYSETFKLEVLRDYYSSGLSKYAIAKKWGIRNHQTFSYWQACYPIDSECLSLDVEPLVPSDMKKEQAPASKEQLLEAEVLRLRKALEVEKLRSHAFQKLIELAEKEEGISILKKGGAKQ
jgi:transposase-like protein